jgi:hypothetical protein
MSEGGAGSSVFNDDNDDPNNTGGSAMMSLFASYYGIEETSDQDKSPLELIDSARFNTDAYVKVTAVPEPGAGC